jgi:hypothetical protein
MEVHVEVEYRFGEDDTQLSKIHSTPHRHTSSPWERPLDRENTQDRPDQNEDASSAPWRRIERPVIPGRRQKWPTLDLTHHQNGYRVGHSTGILPSPTRLPCTTYPVPLTLYPANAVSDFCRLQGQRLSPPKHPLSILSYASAPTNKNFGFTYPGAPAGPSPLRAVRRLGRGHPARLGSLAKKSFPQNS